MQFVFNPLTGQFDLVNTSSGGGAYNLGHPTNIAWSNIPAGTDLTGLTAFQIIEKATIAYLAPLASLSGGSVKEFGDTHGLTLNWSVIKRSNPVTGITVNGNVITPTGLSQSGTQGATATQNVTSTFSMSATDGTGSTTASTSVTWELRKFIGVDANTTLDETGIEALNVSNTLATSLSGAYVFSPSATYKYFCCPVAFGAPAPVIGFKDAATNLNVSMAGPAEGYNTADANGWYYQTVSVTNSTATPYTTNYRVYRTKNVLNGAITIIVS